MSITFYVASETQHPEYGTVISGHHCDCMQRWGRDCDALPADAEWPAMYGCETCDAEINLANGNAFDLLAWVGLEVNAMGHVAARELAPLVRRRLWDEDRNHDPAIGADDFRGSKGARVVYGGRAAGYLRAKCEKLLALCERAGDRLIAWG